MKIERIEPDKILVILTDKELSDFGLKSSELGRGAMGERRFINNILSMAEIKTGIHLRGRHIVLENKPFAGGCMIIINVNNAPRKKLKVYRFEGNFLFVFKDPRRLYACAALIDKADMHLSSRLYKRQDGYVLLIPKNKRSRSLLELLDLFGEEDEIDRFAPTPLGYLIFPNNAVGCLAEQVRRGKNKAEM